MTNAKHTPGPWNQLEHWASIATNDGYAICDMALTYSSLSNKELEANARLIAAAPELLEALQEAVDCGMVPISSAKDGGAVAYSRQVRCADLIRAAITKALEGQA